MAVNPCFLGQATKRDIAKLSQDDVNAFWLYAKENGIFKGLNPDETRAMIADNFKIPERVVSWIMDRNKSARVISEEARMRQKATANFLAANRRYLANMDKSGLEKVSAMYNDAVRRTLLFAHGPVPPLIHALDTFLTNPIRAVRMEGRGIMSLFPEYSKRVMGDLQKQPYYDTALKAGLPIGPQDISKEGFPKSGWANRAMDAALKPFRYELWEAKWKRILQNSPEDATPDMAHKLAIEYAHATGSMVTNEWFERYTRGVRQMLLAPQYVPSKIAKTIFDPFETVKTFERTIESKIPRSGIMAPTPEERILAWNRTWRAGRWLGGTLAALTVNEALLRWFHSNQKINYDNPIRGDWLAFKFAGHMYRMRGSMELIALAAKIGSLTHQKYKYGQQTPEEAVARYGEYKLTPGIGIGGELLSGKDIFGRPAPWSADPGNARFPRKNYLEFFGEHGPIFVGHAISAFHESMRNQGVDTRTLNNVYNAMMRNPQGAIKAAEEGAMEGGAEFFGINIQPDRFIGKP